LNEKAGINLSLDDIIIDSITVHTDADGNVTHVTFNYRIKVKPRAGVSGDTAEAAALHIRTSAMMVTDGANGLDAKFAQRFTTAIAPGGSQNTSADPQAEVSVQAPNEIVGSQTISFQPIPAAQGMDAELQAAFERFQDGIKDGTQEGDKILRAFKRSLLDSINSIAGTNLTMADLIITGMTVIKNANGDVIGVKFDYKIRVPSGRAAFPNESAADAAAHIRAAALTPPGPTTGGNLDARVLAAFKNLTKAGGSEEVTTVVATSAETSATISSSMTINLDPTQTPATLNADLATALENLRNGITDGTTTADKLIRSFKASIAAAIAAKSGSAISADDIEITGYTVILDASGNVIGVTFTLYVKVTPITLPDASRMTV
jgi:hypothetical protein